MAKATGRFRVIPAESGLSAGQSAGSLSLYSEDGSPLVFGGESDTSAIEAQIAELRKRVTAAEKALADKG